MEDRKQQAALIEKTVNKIVEVIDKSECEVHDVLLAVKAAYTEDTATRLAEALKLVDELRTKQFKLSKI